MLIRPATPADCDALATVQVTSCRIAYAGLLPDAYLAQFSIEEQAADWRTLLAAPGDDLLYVAEAGDGRVIGYVVARPGPALDARYDGELVALHVLPAEQGRGAGRALFARVAAEMQARGARSVMLWTLASNPVRSWYARLGGEPAGEQTLDLDGATAVEVAYAWRNLPRLTQTLRASQTNGV